MNYIEKIRILLQEETKINVLIIIFLYIKEYIYSTILKLQVGRCGRRVRVGSLIKINNGKNIYIGDNFIAGKDIRIQLITRHRNFGYKPKVTIGNNVCFNDRIHIGCIKSIKIGNNCLFASNIIIIDHNHGYINNLDIENTPINRELVGKEIIIEDNVWIGENVAILPGAKIRQGAIIGANTVVNKEVPPNSVFVGNPGHVVKQL